ncbi:hypothetical protein BH11ACT2_BH11ACT2_20130 [soil metagenome]
MKVIVTVAIAALVLWGVPAAADTAAAASAAPAAVTGTVTLDGAGVPGIEVGWYDPLTDAAGETVSDAAGGYALEVTDGHPFVLYAGIDHRAAEPRGSARWKRVGGSSFVGMYVGANGADYQYLTLSSFTGALTGQNIALAHPGTITGTNPPLANKKIALENLDHARVRTVESDATGTFTIADLIPGSYRLSSSGAPIANHASYRSPTITVAAGQVARLDPVFAKTGSISGVITNKGEPVAGVSVMSYLENAYGDGDVTDAKGRYTLTRESPGTYDIYLEEGSDDGVINNRRVLATHRTATVHAGKKTRLDIAVKKGGVVSGFVAPTKNEGVGLYVINAAGELVGSDYVQTSRTKATPFTIKAVVTGTATIFLVSGVTKAKKYGSARVTVRGGVNNRVGTLGFSKNTVSLSGKVIGTTKRSVGFDAKVYSLSSGSAKVTNGRYTITGLLPVPGTVSLASTTTRLAKGFAVTPGPGVTRTVRSGGARPRYTGRFLAGLYPVQRSSGSIWLPGRSLDLGSVSVTNGVGTGKRLEPGTGSLDFATFDDESAFVTGSPFFLSVPKAKAKITLKAARTTNAGTVQLVLHR